MKKPKTFEEAMQRLDDINSLLSDSQTGFDESLKLFREAADLIVFCNEKIKNARLVIEECNDTINSGFESPQATDND